MNKKRIRQMDLALRRRLADRPAADCLAGHDELLRRIETEGYMQRFAPLFNGARLRCADVLALCREALDALCGGAPQEGWLSYAYDYARRLLYPEKTGAEPYAAGAVFLLSVLQVLFAAEGELLPHDPAWTFDFLTEQELADSDSRRSGIQSQVDGKLARVAEIDRQLRGTMTELFAASLRRGEGGAPTVEEVRRKNLALQQERAELLARMDLAEDALDDKPACPLCGDTGWRGTEMCRCLRALCAQEQIRELSKLLDLGEQSFDTFRMDYYSTSFWPEWGTSPRENMELVYEVCLNYAQKFGRFYFKNLFLSGAPGLGKTFLSACIARTVSENGHSVVYDTAGNVFAQFEARKFLRDSDDGREARDETRRYLGCDLLILDDLGSELTTQFTQSALYELINGRLVGGKRTVISSNLSMEEAAVRYSPQIASRLEGEYHLLHFFGEDIRLLRKKQL